MASSASHPGSSSMSSSRYTYDVFLNFRIQDTGKNFTDHLYTALVQSGIHTFRYNEDIRKGHNIQAQLRKAVRESLVSIVVFSLDYVSSPWCLDELAYIMERNKIAGHHVLPVFYKVNLEQLNLMMESGVFAEKFDGNEGLIEDELSKVEKWRKALKEATDLKGMSSGNMPESVFVQEIVKEVAKKLRRKVLHVAPYLVGIDSRVKDINKWLRDDHSEDVSIATIYGIAGIGKTTIGKTVFNHNFDKFDARSFVGSVRERVKESNGMLRMVRQILSDILESKTSKVYSVDEGINQLKRVVCCRRVLLVLDDVGDLDQLNAIISMRKWFSPGSKIIITTRNERLLRPLDLCTTFKVSQLDDEESLQLLSWHAFGQNHPEFEYIEVSKSLAKHCDGLPLALRVLGSSLSGKSPRAWKSKVNKLEEIADNKIQEILKMSYNSLEDNHDKNVFLHVACFFIGKDKELTILILDGCNFCSTIGIENLCDRCLLTINESDKLAMHQLLRDMGREIIRQESPDFPGRRSRLWHPKDVLRVLQEKSGTVMVQGLKLDLQSRQRLRNEAANNVESSKRRFISFLSWKSVETATNSSLPPQQEEYLETDAFSNMYRMQLLDLNDVKLKGSYGDLPKGLIWLSWHAFPLDTIPANLSLHNLVALDLRNSRLKRAWRGTRFLLHLKSLNLSHSHELIATPNFKGLTSLERLILKDCINLTEVDESIGELKRLILLNLKNCKSLKKLPGKIIRLTSLEELILSGCSNLTELPRDMSKMESLWLLLADGTCICQKEFGTSSEMKHESWSTKSKHLLFWSWISLRKPTSQSNDFSLANLPASLVILDISDCKLSDHAMLKDFGYLPFLGSLNLSGNQIRNLPDSIKNLSFLTHLILDRCKELVSLPELPESLTDLNAKECFSLETCVNLPNLHKFLNLEIYDSEKLVEVQGLFRLETLTSNHLKMINDIGLFHLESAEGIEVELSNILTMTERKVPLQMLYECGITSVFLPGGEIPDWYSHCCGHESCISLLVPDQKGLKIQGLNLCVIYALSTPGDIETGDSNYIKVSNEDTCDKWTYSPNFYAIPQGDQEMLWLSHWYFGDDQLKAGNEIHVSVVMAPGFEVRKCGVHLVSRMEAKGKEIVAESDISSSWSQKYNLGGTSMLAYQLEQNAYFLSNHSYLTFQEKISPFKIRNGESQSSFEDNQEESFFSYHRLLFQHPSRESPMEWKQQGENVIYQWVPAEMSEF